MLTLDTDINTERVKFNAVLDVQMSDVGSGATGGAQVLNDTYDEGTTFQSDDLIDGVIYLAFIDGIQYTQVEEIVSGERQFTFDSDTGTITTEITILDGTSITVFYYTSGNPIAGVEPVTVAEFKAYAKLGTGTAEDDIITELIATAREQCEDYTGISIVNRTVTAIVNNSCGGIYFPYCPFISLVSITDKDGNVLTSDDYTISGTMWPQLIYPKWDRLELVYTTGYGIPPNRVKTAILQQTFFLYNNRGDVSETTSQGNVTELSLTQQAKATLRRIKR